MLTPKNMASIGKRLSVCVAQHDGELERFWPWALHPRTHRREFDRAISISAIRRKGEISAPFAQRVTQADRLSSFTT
jgi:hypothetical protein